MREMPDREVLVWIAACGQHAYGAALTRDEAARRCLHCRRAVMSIGDKVKARQFRRRLRRGEVPAAITPQIEEVLMAHIRTHVPPIIASKIAYIEAATGLTHGDVGLALIIIGSQEKDLDVLKGEVERVLAKQERQQGVKKKRSTPKGGSNG